jgi:hypothetical protein
VGREPALVDQIGAHLPKSYRARVRRSGDHSLTADAGDYVPVRGAVAGAGQVRVAADTGCRPLTGRVSEAQPDTADRAPVQAVLATLGLSGARWQTHRVPCPRGGTLSTVQAEAPVGAATRSLAAALREASPNAVIAGPGLYVYRDGPAGVVARTHDGVVTVTATTGCATQ